MYKHKNKIFLIISLFLFILPFSWYKLGTLHGGGDDSRLYYLFPWQWLVNFSLHTWNALSSFSSYGQQTYTSGIMLLLSILKIFIPIYLIQPFIYGLTLSGGFISFFFLLRLILKESLREEFQENKFFTIGIIGGLMYILSPIIFFTDWQIQLLQIIGILYYLLFFFFFLKAVYSETILYLILGALISVIFSATILSPWFIAFLIGFLIFIAGLFIYDKKKFIVLKYLFFYLVLIILINFYWVLPGFLSMVSKNGFATDILTTQARSNSLNLINGVASNNSLIYPFVNLFHKSIISNFNWPTKNIFLSWYPSLISVDFLYIFIILIASFIIGKKHNNLSIKTLYISLLISFLTLIYFFTVKIGNWGIPLFFWLTKYIPGWIMFRNFYGKFPVVYVLFYSFLFSVSLYVITSKIKARIKRIGLIISVFILIILNAWPFLNGSILRQPISTTKNIYTDIVFPKDYLKIASYIKHQPDNARYITMPLNIAQYLITTSDENFVNNIYAGVSPLKILTGKDDFSGSMSFINPYINHLPKLIDKLIINSKYQKLLKLFYIMNIKYVIWGNNIPKQIQQSYLYKQKVLAKQQTEEFEIAMLKKRIASYGNFSLYTLNIPISNNYLQVYYQSQKYTDFNSLINKNWNQIHNLIFLLKNSSFSKKMPNQFTKAVYKTRKINQTKYFIHINSIDKNAKRIFLSLNESYHLGWNIYIADSSDIKQKEKTQFVFSDIKYLWKKPVDKIEKHFIGNGYNNTWEIKNLIDRLTNKDLDLIIYFKPQSYMYFGLIISGITLITILGYLGYEGIRNAKLKKKRLSELEEKYN